MKRKKINPNRVPVSPGDYDLEQIKEQATSGMVLQEWAVILATLSNLQGMTTEKLLDFIAGVAYHNDNQVRRVAPSAYLILPYDAEVMADGYDERYCG